MYRTTNSFQCIQMHILGMTTYYLKTFSCLSIFCSKNLKRPTAIITFITYIWLYSTTFLVYLNGFPFPNIINLTLLVTCKLKFSLIYFVYRITTHTNLSRISHNHILQTYLRVYRHRFVIRV